MRGSRPSFKRGEATNDSIFRPGFFKEFSGFDISTPTVTLSGHLSVMTRAAIFDCLVLVQRQEMKKKHLFFHVLAYLPFPTLKKAPSFEVDTLSGRRSFSLSRMRLRLHRAKHATARRVMSLPTQVTVQFPDIKPLHTVYAD